MENKIEIRTLLLGMIPTNTYLLYEENKKEVIIIDPAECADQIKEEITTYGLKPCAILLTHGHFDHIQAAEELRKEYAIPVICHEEEENLLEDMEQNLSKMFGCPFVLSVDKTVRDGDRLELGGFSIKVMHTPGHTKGSCCYYFEKQGVMISGDTLFAQSMGRTDFPTGSTFDLMHSIKEKLFGLPEETKVYSGHGESTTIGYEKHNNPYVK